MISEACKIDEFVEAVKGKEPRAVLVLAVEEADWVDRKVYRDNRQAKNTLHESQCYSRQLKQLINYLRYEVQPWRQGSKVCKLYHDNWGDPGQPFSATLAE